MEFKTRSLMTSISRMCTRSIHHYNPPSKYPKVNVKDVELNPPKYGFRKVLKPTLAQSPTKSLFPSAEIAKLYVENGKPIPNRFVSRIDSETARQNFEEFQEKLAMDEPHFKIGKKQVFLPGGRICLLRNNAKHTPYQAKFLVPKKMNKLDLRDYLWHVYGLRALNITVQLQPAKWVRNHRDLARHRVPQMKKMTIDMAEPFVWPEVSKTLLDKLESEKNNMEELVMRGYAQGSDKKKPIDSYDGMFKENEKVERFIPKSFAKSSVKAMKQIGGHLKSADTRAQVSNFLKL